MAEWIIIILSALGAIFILLAAIGIVRMPDFYLRLSATTKAATLGIGLILVSSAVYFQEISVTSRVFAIIIFLILTAPVAAHMIGRASYFIGTLLWKKSIMDELEGKYEKDTHLLRSEDHIDRSKVVADDKIPDEE